MYARKYQPKTLDEIDFNIEHAKRLKNIADIGYLPNAIFYGSSGSGKRTRVLCLLADTFGTEVYDTNIVQIKSSSKKSLVITYIQSSHHFEIDFKPYGIQDRYVINDFIKIRCQTRNISTKNPKVFVITGADTISEIGQKMLLSIIEKSKKTARFILITKMLCKVSQPLRSRCALIRCRKPTEDELVDILLTIAKNESHKLTKKRATEIVKRSSHTRNPDIRNALHILQMSYLESRYKGYKLKYITYMNNLLKSIKKKDIMKIRDDIFTLTAKNIDAEYIITHIMNELVKDKPFDIQTALVSSATHYTSKMVKGNKTPFYIEAFVANAVNIIEANTVPCI